MIVTIDCIAWSPDGYLTTLWYMTTIKVDCIAWCKGGTWWALGTWQLSRGYLIDPISWVPRVGRLDPVRRLEFSHTTNFSWFLLISFWPCRNIPHHPPRSIIFPLNGVFFKLGSLIDRISFRDITTASNTYLWSIGTWSHIIKLVK